MADDNPDSSQRSLVGRIAQALGGEPRDRKELTDILRDAHERALLGESRDEIRGVLLAKDILKVVAANTDFVLQDHLRKAALTPESKRLNVLLRDFRNNRSHMAIVIDEYGGVAGTTPKKTPTSAKTGNSNTLFRP